MFIDGLWNMLTLPDGTKDPIKYIFHKVIKDRFRTMINNDPEATGSALELLDGLEIDKRLITHEPTDRLIVNEAFFRLMIENYNEEWEKFKPGRLERKYKDFCINFIFALYRNDSEYTSKIGGIISWLVINKDLFANESGNHLKVIQQVYDFWANGSVDAEGNVIQPGDNRVRTKPWIDWGFRYVINKYKRGQKFYMYSVNFFLRYIYVNADKWIFLPAFYPENWYGNNRGYQTIGLYGGNF